MTTKSEAPAPAVPAATVVVARVVARVARSTEASDQVDGDFEVFLVKRHGKSGFMAGAHVFPGGRVDDADTDFDADRFAVAAIRETFEETGVLLVRHESGLPMTSRSPKDAVEAKVEEGAGFSDAVKGAGLVPDVEALIPIAWWITPEAEPKRFDTRFFFAVVPPMQRHDAAPDGHEVTEGVWLTPKAALAAYAKGTIALAPPTLVTLEDLAPLGLDDVRSHKWPRRAIRPVLTEEDGAMVLALPGDPLHDVKDAAWPNRTRIVMRDGGRFESAKKP